MTVDKDAEGSWERLPYQEAEAVISGPDEALRARMRVLASDDKTYGVLLIGRPNTRSLSKAFFERFHLNAHGRPHESLRDRH